MIIYKPKTNIKRRKFLEDLILELIELKKVNDPDNGHTLYWSEDVEGKYHMWYYAKNDITTIQNFLKNGNMLSNDMVNCDLNLIRSIKTRNKIKSAFRFNMRNF